MIYSHSYGARMAGKITTGFDTEFDEVQEKINARKLPPTKAQINEMSNILRDFGYKKRELHIPEFGSVGEMETWQHNMIKMKLDN